MDECLILAATALGETHRFLGLDWNWFVAIGMVGNVIFASRFIVQWIVSEKKGESTIPEAFWYLSIVGSLILLVYFILRREPVGILANLPNSAIYLRNLYLVKKKKERDALEAGAQMEESDAGGIVEDESHGAGKG